MTKADFKRKYQLPAIIVAVGLCYSTYCFFTFATEGVGKLESKLQQRQAALTSKNGELRKLRYFSENIESVKLALRELNLQLESALESMPRTYDLSSLLRKLSVIGFNSGIELSSFRPTGKSEKEGEFYETSSIAFNLTGTYTQILSFFDQALRLKRIIRIDKVGLRVVRADESDTRNAGVSAVATVDAKLYRFMD